MGGGSSVPKEEKTAESSKYDGASTGRTLVTAIGGGNEKSAAYHGFSVDTKVQIDFSVPTNAVEGALTILNVVVKLIQANNNRSQFIKAIEARVSAVSAAVTKLKSRKLDAAGPSLRNLCDVLQDYLAFVEYVCSKPKSFFDKTVNFFRAKSDLENLSQYDSLITRALADLSVPLQTEQLEAQDAQLKELQQVSAQVAQMLNQLKDQKLLAISKKCLTNEESMTFWFECFPDKFQVPVSEFANAFQVWMKESKGVDVSKKQANKVVAAINRCDPEEDAPDDFIDAREVNSLFFSLPIDYTSGEFDKVIVDVSEKIKLGYTEDNKKREEARTRALELNKKTISAVSDDEKHLLEKKASSFHARFLCHGFTMVDGESQQSGLNVVYIFEDRSVHVFGQDKSEKPMHYSGQLWDDMQLELRDLAAFENEDDPEQAHVNAGGPVYKGQYKRNQICCCAIVDGVLRTHYIALHILPWEGYWCQEEDQGDMALNISALGDGEVAGLSDDSVGTAVWRGKITNEEFHVTKKYLGQHFVQYDGAVTWKNGKRQVEGKWDIDGYSDKFSLWEL